MQAVISRTAVNGRAFMVILALTGALMLGGLGGYAVSGAWVTAPAKTIVVVTPPDPSNADCPAAPRFGGPRC